jgi:hypothetical protein
VATRLVRHDTDTPTLSSPAANERLTAWAGAVLFVLLAVEGVTILGLRRLLAPHVFVGVLLIGPVLVKLVSTGYRFIRYYTRDHTFVTAGPPQIVLRVLAPFFIVATLAVLGTGVSLLFVPAPVRDAVVFLHKASFAGWFLLAAVHVFAYLWRVPRLMVADLSARSGPALRRGWEARLSAVTAGVLFGVVLASFLVSRAQPWVQFLQQHRDHEH